MSQIRMPLRHSQSIAFAIGLALLVLATDLRAQTEPPELEFTKWSGAVNVPDPVAISFDEHGRAFVTQTRRRKAQDLDIRAYRQWIPDDVGFQSVDDKRAFFHRVLAPGLVTDKNAKPLIDDFNGDGSHDYHDLTTISERIHVIEDTDGDGTADRISLFADGFQTEVTGIAAGVLWHDGAVYSTIAPDVWRLEDSDGDGRADRRDVIATGFGLHIAYGGHDMHGLTVGPDGRIYWTIGDKGISVTSRKGRRYHYPNQGGVMRCNPDGSDFEVFAHGLRNVQELAFDEFGNLFGVDNDADQPGERERVVYIVEDMDAGWRCNYQYRGTGFNPWMDEGLWQKRFDGQPAYIIPPLEYSLNGPAGFTWNPGTALSPEWRGWFFLTGAPGGEQRAFRMRQQGASFEMFDDRPIGSGVPLVGINFGPDGGLYGVDWGGGYPLNEKGAVWKIDVPGASGSESRLETQRLLREGFRQRGDTELSELLGHADQRVRLASQFELVRRDAASVLIEAAKPEETNRLRRVHAVWGLGQSGRAGHQQAAARLHALLRDADHEIQTQAIRAASSLPECNAGAIAELLGSENARVRFHAALTLRRHPFPAAFADLLRMAESITSDDTYGRHAVAAALGACGSDNQLAELRDHDSASVRLIAVVALRRQKAAKVSVFLRDQNPLVAAEASRAIYDDFSIMAALPALSQTLDSITSHNESLVRRAIGAAFRMGSAEEADRVARYATDVKAPTVLRLDALDALARWNNPPLLDRVDGRRRDTEATQRSINTEALGAVLSSLVLDTQPGIGAAALSAAGVLKIRIEESSLTELADSPKSSLDLRKAALDLLRSQKSSRLDVALRTALQSQQPELRTHALAILAGRDAAATFPFIERTLSESDDLCERQQALLLLGQLQTEGSDQRLTTEFRRLMSGGVRAEERLEVIEAATARAESNAAFRTLVDELKTRQQLAAEQDPAAAFDECLSGGDATAGRELFMTHITVQCIRCHRVEATGSTVGPNLESIALQRNALHLLRAVVAPSADIEPKYRSQIVVLDSGRVVQGLLLRKADGMTVLANAQGREVQIPDNEIDEQIEQTTSIMPDVTMALTRREIRDVVAYLQTLRKPLPTDRSSQ